MFSFVFLTISLASRSSVLGSFLKSRSNARTILLWDLRALAARALLKLEGVTKRRRAYGSTKGCGSFSLIIFMYTNPCSSVRLVMVASALFIEYRTKFCSGFASCS